MDEANSPDWTAVRVAYEAGAATVEDICRKHSVSPSAFYRKRKAEGWTPRRPTAEAPATEASEIDRRRRRRRGLVSRLFEALERQMREIESRIDGEAGERSAAGRERDARTLASLVRTLEKLLGLDTGSGGDATEREGAAHRDIEGLRRALAERIERLASSRADE